MIVILFTFSEFLDFEKRDVKRKLAFSEKIMSFSLFVVLVFLMKNLFLTNLLMFYSSVLFVILMIQIFTSLKILFSDFLKSASSILLFTAGLLTSVSLILFLVSMSMCLRCFKILRINVFIHCIHACKFIKCNKYTIKKIIYHVMSLFSRHELFIADSNRFF